MFTTQKILNKIIKSIFYILLIFSSIDPFLKANDRLRLKNADILERKNINGNPVKLITGNVIFTKGPLTLKCNQGEHFEKDDLAILYDDVSASQEELTMTCDTIKFFSKEDKILSIGKSHVWDKDYDLKADSITIFTKIDSGVAIGNVILIQKGQIIKADRIEYQKEKEKYNYLFLLFLQVN